MDIISKKIDELTPYERNPRKNEAAIDAVAASIKNFGFKVPIVIDQDGVIVAGHTRLAAAKKLGLEEVPVIVADDLTEEQIKAFRLADNKTAELAEWDPDLLEIELKDIESIDMAELGFDLSDPEESQEVHEDDFGDENSVVNEHGVQRGQVWLCGKSRVMCGDSSSSADADKLLGGVLGKMVFTDPPYGVSIGDKNKMLNGFQEAGRVITNIENDTLGTEELYDLLLKCFTNLREHCEDDCSYYVTSPQDGEIGLMMMMMMKDAGLEVRHNLIWEKNCATFSMGQLDYDYKHEPIFYTWTKKHNFYGKGKYKNTIWNFDKPRKCDLHPTMKPVELVAEALLNSSKEEDPVIDFFGGSGTTLIACEQLNRRAFLMELDPHYVDVILSRWEAMTGEKAKILSD